MELKYLKAMEQYKLKPNELSEDALFGIKSIEEVMRMVALAEKNGKAIKPATIKKIMTLDKWVYYEILDQVNDTYKNDDDIPVDTKELKDEVKDQVNKSEEENKELQVGLKIEAELEALMKDGKMELSVEEIHDKAPTTYSVIFDSYEAEGSNGVKTSRFSLLEIDSENEIFKLSKN
jgi:hypothetical protein